jgi:predicted small lipoprotein YifL
MKSLLKSFAFVCIIASLTSCGLFESEKHAQDAGQEVDSTQTDHVVVDTVQSTQDTASQDTGIVIKK